MPQPKRLDIIIAARDRASAALKRVAKTIGAVGLAGAAAGVALGGAAIAGLVLLTKNAFGTADVLAKTADRLGITTEALGGLRHAAELSGASVSTLDKGLEKMARNLDEAKTGIGPAAEAIDRLNLNAADLARLAPEKAFAEIGQAITNLSQPSERVAVAFDLFGRSGVQLLNTLALGKKGLADVQKEAEGLGITMSREAALAIEKANDAMTRMHGALQGLGNIIAPALAPLVERFADFATRILPKVAHGLRVAIQSAVAFAAGASGALDVVRNAFHNVGETVGAVLGSIWGNAKITFGNIATIIGNLADKEIRGRILGNLKTAWFDFWDSAFIKAKQVLAALQNFTARQIIKIQTKLSGGDVEMALDMFDRNARKDAEIAARNQLGARDPSLAFNEAMTDLFKGTQGLAFIGPQLRGLGESSELTKALEKMQQAGLRLPPAIETAIEETAAAAKQGEEDRAGAASERGTRGTAGLALGRQFLGLGARGRAGLDPMARAADAAEKQTHISERIVLGLEELRKQFARGRDQVAVIRGGA